MELTDVTLREGDQRPGRSYGVADRVEAGIALDELGISYIQAGFPATGERDSRAIRQLAATVEAGVVGIARAVPSDVDAAIDADVDVVEVFAPLSERHLRHVVETPFEEMRRSIRAAIDRATDRGATVHLSLLDAFRTDPDRLRAVIDAFGGVEYVNLADTVGITTPAGVTDRLDRLEGAADFEDLSVHFHDDLGVATANVLAARASGVGKADVSVAGIGERAGNAALEEVAVGTDAEDGPAVGVDRRQLIPVCRRVLERLSEASPADKSVLGRDVVRHESGLHTAAMLEEPSTFEPFDPARYGGQRELVFGEGTGRQGARRLLERAGIEPTEDRIEAFLDVLAANGPIETDDAVELAQKRFDGAGD